VLRKLGELLTYQMGSGEERYTPSKLSHRSHDNIGYMRSPLIEGFSSDQDDKTLEEEELSSEDYLVGDDFEDTSDEGIPHGAELVG
jgi:hypothetical protein